MPFNFTWKAKYYALANLKEVVFEYAYQRPNGMRIITKDFKSKTYLAGTLRENTWLALEKTLNTKGVSVRNEL